MVVHGQRTLKSSARACSELVVRNYFFVITLGEMKSTVNNLYLVLDTGIDDD